MTRVIVCWQCGNEIPERASVRFSLTPERTDPSGDLTFVRHVCAECATEIRREPQGLPKLAHRRVAS